MTRKITKVKIRYDNETLLFDDDALGFVDYLVSIQGADWRPAKDTTDLFATREDLKAAGYVLVDETADHLYHAGAGYDRRFTEYWTLNPPADSPQDPYLRENAREHERRLAFFEEQAIRNQEREFLGLDPLI